MSEVHTKQDSSFSSDQTEYQFAGFWVRLGATLIDVVILLLVTLPILWLVYGNGYFAEDQATNGLVDILLGYVLPVAFSLLFWRYKSATPGKMLLGLKIVNADTGQPASMGKLILRYIGYIPSSLVFGIGYLWIAFDKRKQGWHDKIGNTIVIRTH